MNELLIDVPELIRKLTEENEKLRSTLLEKTRAFDQEKESIVISVVDAANSKIKQANERIEILERKILVLEFTNNSFQQEIAQHSKQLACLHQSLSSSEARMAAFTLELSAKSCSLLQMEKEFNQSRDFWERALHEAKDRSDRRISEQEAELRLCKDMCSDLQSRVTTFEAIVSGWEEERRVLEGRVAEKEAVLAEREAQLREMQCLRERGSVQQSNLSLNGDCQHLNSEPSNDLDSPSHLLSELIQAKLQVATLQGLLDESSLLLKKAVRERERGGKSDSLQTNKGSWGDPGAMISGGLKRSASSIQSALNLDQSQPRSLSFR